MDPAGVAVRRGVVWVANEGAGNVARVDARANRVLGAIKVGNDPTAIAADDAGVWIANREDDTVARVDAERLTVKATIPVGRGPSGIVASRDAVWVANGLDGTVTQIDPRRAQVASRLRVGAGPVALALAGDVVWVSALAARTSHRGGVLRSPTPLRGVEPAAAYDFDHSRAMSLLYDGLLGFRRSGGPAGTRLVPNLATDVASPTDSGRTYSFQLRRGIRYSDGRRLKASDFRSSIERVLLRSDARSLYGGIVGARACMRNGDTCDLRRGIVTDDALGTIAVHLVRADSDFPYVLGLPWAFVVPGDPRRAVLGAPPPGTGPYRVTRWDRRTGSAILDRNPRFRSWSHDAQPGGYPDRIVMRNEHDPAVAVRQGRADWGFPDPRRTGALAHGSADRLHLETAQGLVYAFLNTRRPPFDDVRARRALNYAIDRRVAVAAQGGPGVAQPTCQILPPSFPAYRPYCRYSLNATTAGVWTAPDMAKAARLVRASRTAGTRVTVWTHPDRRAFAGYLADLLRQLGYRATIKVYRKYATVADSRTGAQIGVSSWLADYPAPSAFLGALVSCAGFVPRSATNTNLGAFCDRRVDARIRSARRLQIEDPARASRLWARVDRMSVDRAALVPLVTPQFPVLVSARVGNYQWSPIFGPLLDQMWVQ
jgi:YVTN family beta-propeller protein